MKEDVPRKEKFETWYEPLGFAHSGFTFRKTLSRKILLPNVSPREPMNTLYSTKSTT